MTRIVGLTGGIACGKSTVSKQLLENGITVIDCDLIARQVVEPGTSAYKAIVSTFGPQVVLDDGSGLNRAKLGEIIFKDVQERKKLSRITGPAIFKQIMKQLLVHFCIGTPIVVIDAPTLYETKTLLYVCSIVVVVAATEEHQLERMEKRDGLNKEQALDRIKAQLPVEEKARMANIVIWNDAGLEDLNKQIKSLVNTLEDKYKRGYSLFLSLPGLLAFATIFYLASKLRQWR